MSKLINSSILQYTIFLIAACGALGYIIAAYPVSPTFYRPQQTTVESGDRRSDQWTIFFPGQAGYREWTASELIAELKHRRKQKFPSGCDYPPYPHSTLVALGKDAVPALSEELSKNFEVSILDILAKIGEPAVPALAKFLEDPRPEVRLHILNALGHGPISDTISSRAGAVIPAVLELLKDTESFVVVDTEKVKLCERAERFLRHHFSSPPLDILPELKKAAADSRYPLAQRTAARMLGCLGADAREAVPALIDATDSADEFVRLSAIHALGKIGGREAVPALIDATDSADESVRLSAIRALGKIGGPEAVTCLAMCLDKMPEHSWTTVEALGETKEPSAIPVLVGQLRAGRGTGIVAKMFKNFGEEAVDYLVPLLTDKKPKVRDDGIRALSYLGPNAKRATESLHAALKDYYLFVRSSAAIALGNIGPEAAVAVFDLMKEVRRGNRDAVTALGKMGPAASEAVYVISEILKDKKRHYSDKCYAARSLGRIGAAAKMAIPYLEALIEEFPGPNSRIREEAEEAIKLIRKACESKP